MLRRGSLCDGRGRQFGGRGAACTPCRSRAVAVAVSGWGWRGCKSSIYGDMSPDPFGTSRIMYRLVRRVLC